MSTYLEFDPLAIPPRKACDTPRCAGAFIDVDALRAVRCDTCKRFSCDEEASDFINFVLSKTRL